MAIAITNIPGQILQLQVIQDQCGGGIRVEKVKQIPLLTFFLSPEKKAELHFGL